LRLSIVLALALPAIAAAQSKGHARQPFNALGQSGCPRHDIAHFRRRPRTPLPTFDLPRSIPRSRFAGCHRTELTASAWTNRQGGFGYGFQYPLTSFIYVMPPYYMDGYGSLPVDEASGRVLSAACDASRRTDSANRAATTMGWMRLELDNAAAGAQLYVNGYFVGTMDDVNGELALNRDRTKSRFVRPGSPSIHFDVQIVGRSNHHLQGRVRKDSQDQPRSPGPPALGARPFISFQAATSAMSLRSRPICPWLRHRTADHLQSRKFADRC
jgi:hypothetical protein